MDLYERRAKVYDLTKEFLAKVCNDREFGHWDVTNYRALTSEAVFLFKVDVVSAIKRRCDAGLEIELCDLALKTPSDFDIDRFELKKGQSLSMKRKDMKIELHEELKGLPELFAPYMSLRKG